MLPSGNACRVPARALDLASHDTDRAASRGPRRSLGPRSAPPAAKLARYSRSLAALGGPDAVGPRAGWREVCRSFFTHSSDDSGSQEARVLPHISPSTGPTALLAAQGGTSPTYLTDGWKA